MSSCILIPLLSKFEKRLRHCGALISFTSVSSKPLIHINMFLVLILFLGQIPGTALK